ncbi:MAG: hypothetical protein AAGD92_08965 [Pseudomonadota bacterium]
MKLKTYAAIAVFAVMSAGGQAYAQSTIDESLQASAVRDAEAALKALKDGNYTQAATRLEFAAQNANQLKIRNISSRLSSKAPRIDASDIKFALAGSSTLSFDAFQAINNAAETTYTDDKGRTVKVRIFSDEDAIKAFESASADTAMLQKAGVETATMAGATAIKRRGDNGELSVLMMSEADHALIEIEGESEESVMELVEKLEK